MYICVYVYIKYKYIKIIDIYIIFQPPCLSLKRDKTCKLSLKPGLQDLDFIKSYIENIRSVKLIYWFYIEILSPLIVTT